MNDGVWLPCFEERNIDAGGVVVVRRHDGKARGEEAGDQKLQPELAFAAETEVALLLHFGVIVNEPDGGKDDE